MVTIVWRQDQHFHLGFFAFLPPFADGWTFPLRSSLAVSTLVNFPPQNRHVMIFSLFRTLGFCSELTKSWKKNVWGANKLASQEPWCFLSLGSGLVWAVRCLGLVPDQAQLCDLEQVHKPLWVSLSSFAKLKKWVRWSFKTFWAVTLWFDFLGLIYPKILCRSIPPNLPECLVLLPIS